MLHFQLSQFFTEAVINKIQPQTMLSSLELVTKVKSIRVKGEDTICTVSSFRAKSCTEALTNPAGM
jgi:hypothetical protein